MHHNAAEMKVCVQSSQKLGTLSSPVLFFFTPLLVWQEIHKDLLTTGQTSLPEATKLPHTSTNKDSNVTHLPYLCSAAHVAHLALNNIKLEL